MLVILPFEESFYDKWKYKVEFVGHPLVQVVQEFRQKNHPLQLEISKPAYAQRPIIALLPGSRKQEIAKKLPIMLEASRNFPDHRFVIAQAPGQSPEFYLPFMQAYEAVELTAQGQTYSLLQQATAALVTSGTATLETALFGVPQVVCYKGSPISYHIAKAVITIKYISLVNLIMDRQVVTELIQHELTPVNVTRVLNELLFNENQRKQLKADYEALWQLLAQNQNASAKAAAAVYQLAAINDGSIA
jgi:lipid-A-disaccharide synthase